MGLSRGSNWKILSRTRKVQCKWKISMGLSRGWKGEKTTKSKWKNFGKKEGLGWWKKNSKGKVRRNASLKRGMATEVLHAPNLFFFFVKKKKERKNSSGFLMVRSRKNTSYFQPYWLNSINHCRSGQSESTILRFNQELTSLDASFQPLKHSIWEAGRQVYMAQKIPL